MEENTIMAEALSAIEGKVTLAPSKIPEGKTLVAISMDRGGATTQYMVPTPQGWRAEGVAIAILNGHVVEGNLIFGHVSKGLPKITAAHRLICSKCGSTCIQPPAVWAAKDRANKEAKITFPKKTPAMKILREWGKCSFCGAEKPFEIASEDEKADIDALARKTLDALEASTTVPPLVKPEFFNVLPLDETCPPLPPSWEWLAPGLATIGRRATPFSEEMAEKSTEAMVYNPGFWLGWVDDPHETELFWLEKGQDRRGRRGKFSLDGIEGL